MEDSDAGGVVLTQLRTWCATQVPGSQKDSRAAIIDIVKRFMSKVSDLLLVHATVFLRLPPKPASHEHAWRRWKDGVMLMLRDHLCRSVLLTEPSTASRKLLDNVMSDEHIDIENRWTLMMTSCRKQALGAHDVRV